MTPAQSPWKRLEFRRLLFPTDGSRDSHVAVLQLVPLALASGAAVTVLEVVESQPQVMARASAAGWLPAGDGFLTDENARELAAVQRRAATSHLRAVQEELEHAGVADVDCLVEEGHPGPAIVDVAERLDCDAVVMGTHGRSGLARLLLGSVAEYVTRHAPCPLLLVPTASGRAVRGPSRASGTPADASSGIGARG